MEDAAELHAPRQIGYGIMDGAEAAVRATRKYLQNMLPNDVIVKLVGTHRDATDLWSSPEPHKIKLVHSGWGK